MADEGCLFKHTNIKSYTTNIVLLVLHNIDIFNDGRCRGQYKVALRSLFTGPWYRQRALVS